MIFKHAHVSVPVKEVQFFHNFIPFHDLGDAYRLSDEVEFSTPSETAAHVRHVYLDVSLVEPEDLLVKLKGAEFFLGDG